MKYEWEFWNLSLNNIFNEFLLYVGTSGYNSLMHLLISLSINSALVSSIMKFLSVLNPISFVFCSILLLKVSSMWFSSSYRTLFYSTTFSICFLILCNLSFHSISTSLSAFFLDHKNILSIFEHIVSIQNYLILIHKWGNFFKKIYQKNLPLLRLSCREE